MKISDITQRSQVQHIAEGRKQLDEAIFMPAVWTALGVTGAGWTAYETWQNYEAYKRGEIDEKEFKARVGGDVALGLIGGGGATVAKALGKAGWRGAKRLMGFGDDPAKLERQKQKAIDRMKKAEAEVAAAKNKNPTTPAEAKKQANKINKAKNDFDQAKIDKNNLSKRKKDARILPTKGELVKNALKYGGAGLAVHDKYDPLRDPTYRALGGANPDGSQPKAGESLADAEARLKADAVRDQKRKVRFSGPSSHRSGVGVIGQDQYDITSQKIKQWEKEKVILAQLEKEAAEAAEAAKAERQAKAAAAATAEKQANQQDQSKEK
jgi:hypothetical protein